jgi:hypothetical protein
MASTLQGDNGAGRDRVLGRGHGTSALGPSDTTDSGSDITGGPGLLEGDVIGLDKGTNDDMDVRGPVRTAGPDIGDTNLDSDSDSVGTGEHRTAGRDVQSRPDADRSADRIVSVPDVPAGEEGSGLSSDRGGGSTGSGRHGTGGPL